MKTRKTLSDSGRIGIANRGEAALRFIRAVTEFNRREGTSLETVSFFIDAEKDALFAQESDYTHALSSFSEFRNSPASPYLNRALMLQALRGTDCSAVWPGWGFLSEDGEFVSMLEAEGLVFLGPPAGAMQVLGDKIAAKELAERTAVPIVPWSRRAVRDLDDARELAEAIGYPCIVKAANAGGGRGIRFVMTPDDLAGQFKSAVEETLRVTGNSVVFIERLVEKGRHLEVQVLADRQGTVRTFGVRDCSVQRKNQKIIEETPPPGLGEKVIASMQEASARLVRAAGYESAGTVEYLYDLARGEFYFMEVNTRLQVEHPVTEQLYGVDLVRGQILVARGGSIKDFPAEPRGSVIEARLNAEDPDRGFRPAPGRVTRFKIPAGPGLRVDSGIEQGSAIPGDFDSMVAKLIAFGPDRATTVARLERALREMRVRIEGGTTNRAFLMELLSLPEIRGGGVHTRFVEEYLGRRRPPCSDQGWALALAACAVEQYLQRLSEEFANFSQQLAVSAQPREISPSRGIEATVAARGASYRFVVEALGGDLYVLSFDEGVCLVRYDRHETDAVMTHAGRRHHVQLVERGDCLQCEMDGVPYAIETDSGGVLKAPSPAVVLSIAVAPGQAVGKGQVVLTLEAMKMEMVVSSPQGGVVGEIFVKQGEQVPAGRALLSIEADERQGGEAAAAPRVALGAFLADPKWDEAEILARRLDAVFLGYDCSGSPRRLLEQLQALTAKRGAAGTGLLIGCLRAYNTVELLLSGERALAEGAARPASFLEYTSHYFKRTLNREKGLPPAYLAALERALDLYGLTLKSAEREVKACLFRMYRSRAAAAEKAELLVGGLSILEGVGLEADGRLANLLDECALLSQTQGPALADSAINARYRLFDRALLAAVAEEKRAKTERILDILLRSDRHRSFAGELMARILDYGRSAVRDLLSIITDPSQGEAKRDLALAVLARRMVRDRPCLSVDLKKRAGLSYAHSRSSVAEQIAEGLTVVVPPAGWKDAVRELSALLRGMRAERIELLVYVAGGERAAGHGARASRIGGPRPAELARAFGRPLPRALLHVGIAVRDGDVSYSSYAAQGDKRGFLRTEQFLDMDPLFFRELRVGRLRDFDVRLLHAVESVRLVQATARGNPRDERLVAFVDVGTVKLELDSAGAIRRFIGFDNAFMDAVYALRAEQIKRRQRLQWNRIVIHIRPVLDVQVSHIQAYADTLAARTLGLGIEKLIIYARNRGADGSITETELRFENFIGLDFTLTTREPSSKPLEPFDAYVSRVVRARQRGVPYPYEIVKMLTQAASVEGELSVGGRFEEYDLAARSGAASFWRRADRSYVSVKDRPYGKNSANVVFGVITNEVRGREFSRVLLLSDPTTDLGSLAEPECLRVNAALDLAEDLRLPVEWIPVSAGAKIDMDSGTENLDWTACSLRRIVEFTQRGGEINIIVTATNVGAQSYWNAEATMLMHTRGLLLMSDEGCMLLTGKKALDFSGGVSAEDNLGIGGVEKIMEPNGQAQVRVRNLKHAYELLFRHYELTYAEPSRFFPARSFTSDPIDRDAGSQPYQDPLGQGFRTIADIFSPLLNPERKKPFDIRQVMAAVCDQDHPTLERWPGMLDAETSVVWEARIGGWAAGLIGIESRSLARQGGPADGPESWSGGTLFPLSSKKTARAINAFSARLPLVILANLSGFDGSPESLRKLQLEYGAEIGRAVVNFRGPIIFVVIARYHGGAYVVFSKSLNRHIHALALEGSFASVIGGAPAAVVVFPSQVLKDVYADERIVRAQAALKEGGMNQKSYDELLKNVHAEKQVCLAQKFDRIHSVERALRVGSIDAVVSVAGLRPYIVERLELGMRAYLEGALLDAPARGSF